MRSRTVLVTKSVELGVTEVVVCCVDEGTTEVEDVDSTEAEEDPGEALVEDVCCDELRLDGEVDELRLDDWLDEDTTDVDGVVVDSTGVSDDAEDVVSEDELVDCTLED